MKTKRWLYRGFALAWILLASCREKPPAEVLVRVKGVGFDYANRSPVVILVEKEGTRQLPIWIGPAEAQAIAMRLEEMTPPRPMTHDLLQRLLEEAGAEVQKVVVTSLKDGVYFAEIYLEGKRGLVRVDSRPSDAIALAVRCDKPIFVSRALLEQESRPGREAEPELRARAGITVQNLTAELAQFFGLNEATGVIVTAAEAATGLRAGDSIVAIDGRAIRNVEDFARAMDRTAPGAEVHLVVRRGSEKLEVTLPGRGS